MTERTQNWFLVLIMVVVAAIIGLSVHTASQRPTLVPVQYVSNIAQPVPLPPTKPVVKKAPAKEQKVRRAPVKPARAPAKEQKANPCDDEGAARYDCMRRLNWPDGHVRGVPCAEVRAHAQGKSRAQLLAEAAARGIAPTAEDRAAFARCMRG